MGIKEKDQARPLQNVFDASLDEYLAPSLYDVVLKKAHEIYQNPSSFFALTHLSDPMKSVLREIARLLRSQGGRNIYPLFSLFGGGKTHTLITIYHAFEAPQVLETVDKNLASDIIGIGKYNLVVLDCDSDTLVPDPSKPLDVKGFKLRTIWGALAHQLGRYGKMRERDESGVVPTPSELRDLLEETPALILIDELVKYVHKLRNSNKDDLRKYSEAVYQFAHNLSAAVIGSKTVLILTLPVDVKSTATGLEEYIYEKVYESEASTLWRMIQRSAGRFIVPLTVDDVVEVLKKRLFEPVSLQAGRSIQELYIRDYSENPEIFTRAATNEATRIGQYYPFHPSYIATLYEIVTRVPELQKTRDAIKISRMVVRRIWKFSNDDPDLIMPWHIDLADSDIRSQLITVSLANYEQVANEDIIKIRGNLGRIGNTSKPHLALIVATSIFLKTYTYGGEIPTVQKPYPVEGDIAYMAYEKNYFAKKSLRIMEIRDTLAEMRTSLVYLQDKDERYWFTPYPNIIERIEKTSEDVKNPKAMQELLAISEKAKSTDVSYLVGGKRAGKSKVNTKVFNDDTSVVLQNWNSEQVEDDDKYKLVIIFRQPNMEDLRKMIYQQGDRDRKYKNSLVVTYANEAAAVTSLLEKAKKYVAAELVVDQINKEYKDETLREIYRRKASEYRDRSYGEILHGALTALDSVAFPYYNEMNSSEDIQVSPTASNSSIIAQVESTLQEIGVSKIPTEIYFDGFLRILNERLGIDLESSNQEYSVRTINEYFLTNPRLPIVSHSTLVDNLLEGIGSMRIGIRKKGRIYWKKIFEDSTSNVTGIEEGELPSTIDFSDNILPWRLAAREVTEQLTSQEGIQEENGVRKRIWFSVIAEGSEKRLSEVVKQPGYEEIVRAGRLTKRSETIKEAFFINISDEAIETNPDAEINVIVRVEPVGVFDYPVTLSVDRGKIEPISGKPPFVAQWNFRAPDEAGVFSYHTSALGGDPKGTRIANELKIIAKGDIAETTELSSSFLGKQLLAIRFQSLDDCDHAVRFFASRSIKTNIILNLSIKGNSGDELALSATKLDGETATYILKEIINVIDQPTVTINRFDLKILNDLKIDENLLSYFKPLNSKVSYSFKGA